MILHKLKVVGIKMSIKGMPAVWWLGDYFRATSGRHAYTILFDGLYEELIIADNSKELE